jgi:hypothetical protein
MKHYERNEFKYNWLGMKLDAELMTLGETQSFKANIRLKKDSVIWVSITPALGIEVFRVLITPDSVKYISKIPDNKYYYSGDFSAITELMKVDIDFAMLQDLLIGNAIGLDKEEGKFRSEIDNDLYLMISKYKRRVKRVVGVDDRKLLPTDTISINPNDRRYQRAVRKDDDLIISRYWLEGENFRLVKSLFDDLLHQRTVQLNYGEFKMDHEQYYPSQCALKVRSADQIQELNFEITKLVSDKTYEFPFEVPEDYERKPAP